MPVYFIRRVFGKVMDLDRQVFGRITAKEIIGASPPAVPDTKNLLAFELDALLVNLRDKSRKDLLGLLAQQEEAVAAINSRPGAMALAQDKIRIFNEYSDRYVDAIKRAAA